MADAVIFPGKLKGEIDFAVSAPSKSILHREIICSALAGGDMPYFDSEDIKATYGCMKHILVDDEPCNVYESASTLRFLMPLSVYLGGRTFLTQGRLSQRPLSEYSCMRSAHIERVDNKIITSGELKSGDFYLRGDISSQFVTGLMLALPLLPGDSRIHITHELQSNSYVDMTQNTLLHYGIEIKRSGNTFFIPGNKRYERLEKTKTEGDWSYAAFFVVANELGSKIILKGLNKNSLQADSAIKGLLHKTEIDVSQCPDLFPILCVLACGKNAAFDIYNAKRVRLKESDRVSAMVQELKKLGADIKEKDDGVIINGTGKLRGGEVDAHSDHRVAMALGIAAKCICTDSVTIHGAECVRKSAPRFWEQLSELQNKN